MSRSRHPVRACYAFGLMLVMGMQWFAGSVYLRRTVVVEITDEMTRAERSIADAVNDEFGFQADVRIVDASQVEFIQGLGYAAPFVHSMDVDGEVNAFTVDNPSARYQTLVVDIQTQRSSHDDQSTMICLDRLFTPFCIGEASIPGQVISCNTEHHFLVSSLYDLFQHGCPSPPPWTV